MTSLFLTIARLFRAFKRSLKDPEFKSLFLVVFALLLSGTLFYHLLEGWDIIDSLYFSATTLTTVGSPMIPVHFVSKVFTVVYLFVGIGVMLTFLARVADQAKKEASVAKSMAIESYEKSKQLVQALGNMFEEKEHRDNKEEK